jgi:hypothetical protein
MPGEDGTTTTDVTPVDPSTTTTVQPQVDQELTLPADAKAETKERFNKLLDERRTMKERLSAYEKFGTPEEIAAQRGAQVQKLDQINDRIERMEEARQPGEPKSEEQKRLESLRARAKAEIRDLDDGIAKGEQAYETQQAMQEGLEEDALEATVEVLKEYGLPTDDASLVKWSKRFANEIKGDRRLHLKYWRNPEAAIRKAAKAYFDDIGTVNARKADAQVQRDKEKLGHLPKPHGSGGGTADNKPPAPAQSVAEGMQRFRARLREVNAKGG